MSNRSGNELLENMNEIKVGRVEGQMTRFVHHIRAKVDVTGKARSNTWRWFGHEE